MTFKKARKRYPYGTRIKYLGDKEFTIYGGNYDFCLDAPGIYYFKENATKGTIGKIVGLIREEDNNDNAICTGVYVEFGMGWDFVSNLPVELLFDEDLFVRL